MGTLICCEFPGQGARRKGVFSYGTLRKLRFADKQGLIKRTRGCHDAHLKGHDLIIVNLINGHSVAEAVAAFVRPPSAS